MIPAHIDSGEFLDKLMDHTGLAMVLDKFESAIVPIEAFIGDILSTTEEFVFSQKPYYSRQQIIEYKIDGYSSEAADNLGPKIDSNSQTDDPLGKLSTALTKTDPAKMLKQLGGQLANGTKIADMSFGEGVKYTIGGTAGPNPAQASIDALNLQKMEIWVPGANINRLNKKISVELPTDIFAKTGTQDTFRGDWIVYRMIDVIVDTIFIQKLFLRRASS